MNIESFEELVGKMQWCPSAKLGKWHHGRIVKTENPNGTVTFGCECGGGSSVTYSQHKDHVT